MTMTQSFSAALALTIAASRLPCESRAEDPPTNNLATAPALDELVDQYFRANDSKERTKLAFSIEEAAGGSIEAIAASVQQIPARLPFNDTGRIIVTTTSAGDVTATFQVMLDAEGRYARAMFLCLPAKDELAEEPRATIRAVTLLAPAISEGCFVVGLDKPVAGSFLQHVAAAQDLRKIVRELRRTLYVDTNRLFLIGAAEGGEAAWIAALFQPDLFAGVITVSSAPRLPFVQQHFPLLADNLRGTAVFSIVPPDNPSLNAWTRFLADFTGQRSVPIRIAQVAYPSNIKLGPIPDRRAIAGPLREFLSQGRNPPGRPISHWFRYPAQGDVGWLRAVKTYGDVWTEDQLSIAVSPTTDRDAFIADVLKGKLFHLGGRVEGQTIHIETKRIAEVELRLFDGMVDFAKPITVIINGRKRHEGLVRPSIKTMLEAAHEEWEFQRILYAKVSYSIREE